MSEENVNVVRAIYAAFNSGDRDEGLALVDPEVVIDATRNVFNPATYVGLEGVRQWLAAMDETWEEIRPEPQEFLDAGDRVAVMGRLVGKGRASGVKVERPYNGQVWTVRDGRVVRLEIGFTDREATLEARRAIRVGRSASARLAPSSRYARARRQLRVVTIRARGLRSRSDIVLGALVGYVSSRMMDQATTLFYAQQSDESKQREEEIAPGGTVRQFGRQVGEALGKELSDEGADRVGLAFHRTMGVLYGIGTAALVKRGIRPMAAGLGVGTAAFVLVDEGTAISDFTAYPLESHLRGVVGHATLGLVAGALMSLAEGR